MQTALTARWTFVRLIAVVAMSIAPFVASSGRADEPQRFNVLLLIADDLNADLGCFGHPWVQSPHIDRLASEAMRFERAYCQYPLCNPSRASFMTGRLPDQTGVHTNGVHFRENLPEVTTLSQMFREHGYFAARVGKIYHYGVPGEIGTSGVMDDPPSWAYVVNPRGRDKDDEDKIFSLVPGSFGGTLSWLAAEGADDEQTDGIGALAAVRLMEEHADEPFFLAVGFYRPHTPFVAPKAYFAKYPTTSVDIAPRQRNREQLPAGALGSAKPEHRKLTDPLRRECIQAYYAATSFMDAQVGRVLDALDRLGLADTTIVVMTSDHGYLLGQHGLWQKQSVFEPSARVPLVIRVPGMKQAGTASSSLVELVDLYPTLAELCGWDPPAGLAGKSLKPILDDPSSGVREAALTQVQRRGRSASPDGPYMGYSIRTNRYRYTEWDEGRLGTELYDHNSDTAENHNRATDAAYAETVSEMRRLLSAARRRGGSSSGELTAVR